MPRRPRLETYRRKRDFRKTPEPRGKARPRAQAPRFAVQEHDATAHHYDLRLEAEGVLKSWAVPKGPSLDPDVKRLAMPTEDHPMDYASFEGVIPEDNYGAGPVIVWDHGTFVNLSEIDGRMIPFAEAVRRGHAKFWLQGEKLAGGFALIKTAIAGRRPSWLLMKMRDAAAEPDRDLVRERPESVLSGRTIEDVLAGRPVRRRRRTASHAHGPRARTRKAA